MQARSQQPKVERPKLPLPGCRWTFVVSSHSGTAPATRRKELLTQTTPRAGLRHSALHTRAHTKHTLPVSFIFTSKKVRTKPWRKKLERWLPSGVGMVTDPEGPGVMGKFSIWTVICDTQVYSSSKFSKWNVMDLCLSPRVNVT